MEINGEELGAAETNISEGALQFSSCVLTKIIDTRPPNSYFFPSTEYEKNSQLSMIKKGLA